MPVVEWEMQMIKLIKHLYEVFERMAKQMNYQGQMPYDSSSIRNIKNDLTELSVELRNLYPFYSDEMFYLKDYLFINPGFVNWPTYGEIRGMLKSLNYEIGRGRYLGFWAYIHPAIIKVSQKQFIDKHVTASVESAFKEICSRVRAIRAKAGGIEIINEADMMRKTFGTDTPILRFNDLANVSNRNVQEGYSHIFAGSVQAIRNPNAHGNLPMDKADAVRKLMLASLLMYEIDEAIKVTKIVE